MLKLFRAKFELREDVYEVNTAIKGHLLAIFTVICWGTTFISTKILLEDFSPIEILVTRFVIGLTILYIIRPHVLKLRHEEHRLYLFIAALSGITLYYLMENIALTYTYASNVGIITSTAPFFAAILARFTIKNSHLSGPFFVGFILSMIGVFLISVEDGGFNFNLKGDLLALGAAVLWAVYAVVLKKICTFGYDLITVTREIFLYGIVLMIPPIIFMGFDIDLINLTKPINLINMLYLGIGASALCFLTWNFATKFLGIVKTTVYIYVIPVITVVTAYFILSEPITLPKLIGIVFAIAGLVISQK